MNAPSFDPDKYTQDLKTNWSEAAPHYDELSARLFAGPSKRFIEFAGVKAGESVLDAACGSGLATLNAARAVGPSGRVVGADLAPGMLDLGRKRAQAEGLANCEFVERSAEDLGYPDKSFDAVLCQLGLMLFARPDKALAEFKRVSKTGRVACLVQGRLEKMVFTGLINSLLFKRAPELKIPGAPSVFRYGPPGILEDAFSAAGLAPVRIERLEGTFPFDSPEHYWQTMAESSGRMRSMIAGLHPAEQAALKQDVLNGAAAYTKGGRVEIPYEFVMAASGS